MRKPVAQIDQINLPATLAQRPQSDAAGVAFRSEVYAGAPHGFTMADTAMYDEQAAERHWTALFDLLERTFRGSSRRSDDGPHASA